MSLITDTLKKMKKENDSNVEKDDEILAPPALRNAIVNTKKYKEFVKNAELRDVNGNKAPLKGFVLFSILLLAVIGVTAVVFLNKQDKEMVNKAGIVSQAEVGNNANINKQSVSSSNKMPESLGRPYGSTEQVVKNDATPKNLGSTQSNINNNKDNINKQNNTVTVPVQQNTIQTNTVQTVPNKVVESKPVQQANKPVKEKESSKKSDTSNIILPNQLFVIPSFDSSDTADKENTNEKINESSMKPAQNKQETPAVNNVSKVDTKVNTGKVNTNADNTKSYAETVAVKKNDTIVSQNISAGNQGNVQKENISSISSINEVKTIKSKDKPGSVAASTISLYNQYISTGNKAKSEGAYDRAIEYYVNAFALNKSDELSANIALMYIKLKNPNMAFQVSVTNSIKDTKLLSKLAVLMIQQKYYLEANKLIQYANTFQRSSDVLFATGYLNQSQNKLDEAVKYYVDAMSVDGTNVNAAYYAGMCYEMQGKNEDAKKMYEKILSSNKADNSLKAQAKKKISSL